MHLGTRELLLDFGGTEYSAELGNVELTSNPASAGFVTFGLARSNGAREYRINFTAVQDFAPGTLWRKAWDTPGTTVAYKLKPAGGGVTPTATQAHFTGNLIIGEPDGTFLGGAADSDANSRFTWQGSWVCTARPTMLVA